MRQTLEAVDYKLYPFICVEKLWKNYYVGCSYLLLHH